MLKRWLEKAQMTEMTEVCISIFKLEPRFSLLTLILSSMMLMGR